MIDWTWIVALGIVCATIVALTWIGANTAKEPKPKQRNEREPQ